LIIESITLSDNGLEKRKLDNLNVSGPFGDLELTQKNGAFVLAVPSGSWLQIELVHAGRIEVVEKKLGQGFNE